MDNQQGNEAAQDKVPMFASGTYAGLPTVIMAMPGLSASAKLIWMALAVHARGYGLPAWPSLSKMARMTGLAKRTAIRAIEELRLAGLVEVEKADRAVSSYVMLQPDARCQNVTSFRKSGDKMTPANRCQNVTSSQKSDANLSPDTLVTKSHQMPGESANLVTICPKSGDKLSPELLNRSTNTHTNARARAREADPSTGPAPSDSCVCSSSKAPEEKKTAETQEPRPPCQKFATELMAITHVKDAYRHAYKAGMPASWRPKIADAYANDLDAEIAAIDAEAIVKARAATPKGRTFGFGWVMQYVSAKLAAANAATAPNPGTEAARALQAKENERRQREAEEQVRRDAERIHYFMSLTEQQREIYRQSAKQKPFAPKSGPILEGMAMLEAWNNRPVDRFGDGKAVEA
jgi:hypothetical protein